MNKSVKHHYLPQFYLKGFTNDHGQFAIYDCKRGIVKRGMHFPSSHFFELKRNTINIDGNESNILEDVYSALDSHHARLIQYIQNAESPIVLTNEQIAYLQQFISFIFWRLPENDQLYLKEYYDNPRFSTFFQVVNKKNGEINTKMTEKIRQSLPLIKAARFFAGHISQMSSINTEDYHNWKLSYTKTGFKVCSDSPIIFKTPNVKNIFQSDFIFPITKKQLLLRTFNSLEIRFLDPEISLMIDLIIFKQAKLYCCSSRKDYFEGLSYLADKFDIEYLKYRVFKFIDDHPQASE